MRPEASSADRSVTAQAACYRPPDTEIADGGGPEEQVQAHTDGGGGDPLRGSGGRLTNACPATITSPANAA